MITIYIFSIKILYNIMITTIKTNNKKIERDLAHLLKALASWEIHV